MTDLISRCSADEKPVFRRPKTLVAIVTRDIHATRKSSHLTSLLVIGNKKVFPFF